MIRIDSLRIFNFFLFYRTDIYHRYFRGCKKADRRAPEAGAPAYVYPGTVSRLVKASHPWIHHSYDEIKREQLAAVGVAG